MADGDPSYIYQAPSNFSTSALQDALIFQTIGSGKIVMYTNSAATLTATASNQVLVDYTSDPGFGTKLSINGGIASTGTGANTLNLRGLVGPPSTYDLLVHSTASDSGTYQLPVSSLPAPTLQQVLTAGPNFTGNNTIGLAGHVFGLSGLVGPPSTYSAVVHSNASDSGLYQVAMGSGTYTPTLTNTTNISSSGLTTATYSILGNIVHVMISGSFTATVASTSTALTVTLPTAIATSTGDYVGSGAVAVNSGTAIVPGMVQVGSSTTVIFYSYPTLTTSSPFTFSFDYVL
jgi:hypothetical protein